MKEQPMFASIRRYRLIRGSMQELTRRVDDGFADEIRTQPGFVSYEFIDCGEGEIVTISVFGEAQQAEASRDLAQCWTEDNLKDFEFARTEALRGEVLVSCAGAEVLEPAHPNAAAKFASVRRYRLRTGSVAGLMHIVDEVFATDVRGLEGFEAYHALDCGRGEILSISLFRDQSSAEESDERALQFVGEHLQMFDIERTEVLGGEVLVSRAVAQLLEPAHA
jgi:hypothetical protein